MTIALEATGLGKRYGHTWALSECTLAIPCGKVVGLVGPNGAGKTTLLQLSVGLLQPSTGSITVLGGRPGRLRLNSRVSVSSPRTLRPIRRCRSVPTCGSASG